MPSQPLSKAQRMSYRIGRGEMGVLTFEPCKTKRSMNVVTYASQ
jgi:hypothetical protein